MDLKECICYDTLIVIPQIVIYYHSFYYDFNSILYDTIVKDRDYGSFRRVYKGLLYNQDSTICFFNDSIIINSDRYGTHKSKFVKNCHPGSPLIMEFPSEYGVFEYYIDQ